MFANAITTDKIAPPPTDPEGIERMRQFEEQFKKEHEEWLKYFEAHQDEWSVCTNDIISY